MTIPVIETDMDITLPPGVYLLTTAEHPSPVRLLAR